jgi:hypothetical protein
MADKDSSPGVAALRKLEASLHLHWQAHKAKASGAPKPVLVDLWHRLRVMLRGRLLRRSLIGVGGFVGIISLLFALLWWRLASGPIDLDLATPWLTAAIEENFGSRHKVEVGGTQLERDESGRTRLRIRDIVVRDPDGTVVASAPKAEVGFSGASLLTGHVRAERLSLVGAELSVRIEPGGNVTVFAGADKRPIATTSAITSTPAPTAAPPAAATAKPGESKGPADSATSAAAPKPGIENLTALLAWIDGLGATGLDGHDLAELGFKSGNLVVDDQRNGKRWSFENINLSLTRQQGGGVVFSVSSEAEERPWSLSAAVAPIRFGHRVFNLEARRVLAKDLLLALRLGDDPILADVPMSASLHAEIGPDGATQVLQGRIIAEAGSVSGINDPDIKVNIDRAEFNLDWDPSRRILAVPFQLLSGGNRLTLFAQIEPPREQGGIWNLGMTGGTVFLGSGQRDDEPLIFNRILVRARIDPKQKRIELERGDMGNAETGVALSGTLDFATGDPRLAIGFAGTRMKLSALKRIWPVFVASPVRTWVEDRVLGGMVERLVVATNAPFSTFKSGGPPIPEEGLSIELVTSDTVLRPVDELPEIRDADLAVRVTGRTATVNVGRGTVEMPSGRKLTMTGGVFEVPNTVPKEPMSRTRFRMDGPVPAAAELLAMDRLRDISGAPFDPATTRGTLTAQIMLGFPLKRDLPKGSSNYTINIDIANFAADRMVLGQKVEANTLKIAANNQGYQIKGDVKIGGTPAALDYRKLKDDAEAEIRIQATLDEAARTRFGFDLGTAVSGPVAVKLGGRVGSNDREGRFTVEADLTQARIDNLLPGWTKPAGKPARANFALVNKPQSIRFEDLAIEGSGAQVKGNVEVDASGDIISASFPVFSLTDGDKTTFKADRGNDGTLRVTMRGEVYDGRGFVKSALAGAGESKPKHPLSDLDLDIKLGAVVGFNGETLRGIDLKLTRRGGQIRTFALNAKLGRNTPLIGDLRARNARDLVYFETDDAGALFRFTDTYPRMVGGKMWVAMDPPTANLAPQDGILNIQDFAVRGEAALDRVVSGAAGAPREGVKFSRMRTNFTRRPGRLDIRDGVVQGLVGATIDGQIDYVADEVHLRGTFVPLYELNNMFNKLPILGLFLGGSNEGILGVTYEVVGAPGAPRLNVNPFSAVAPGLLRKLFEFRNTTTDRGFAEPAR